MKNIFHILLTTLILAGCSAGSELDLPVPSGGGAKTGKGFGKHTRSFGITIGGASQDESQNTRTSYDPTAEGAVYQWTDGTNGTTLDRTGFYMAPEGTNTPVASNVRMTNLTQGSSQFADFGGDMRYADIARVSPDEGYDYYSYYPYSAANDNTFPNVAFEIPAEINLTPNVFPTEYGFMVADKETTGAGQLPISWLEGTGNDAVQKFGTHVGFNYHHVFAYLEVYLNVNLMDKPVSKIVVTCNDGMMSGLMNINIQNKSITGGSSNSVVVNIDGGLNITGTYGNTPVWNKIWVPINPGLSGRNFNFEFYTKIDGRDLPFHSETKTGIIQAGLKHKAGFVLPFHIDFRQDLIKTNTSGNSTFSSYGHILTCHQDNPVIVDNSIELEGHDASGKDDALKMPLLENTAYHPNYAAKGDKPKCRVKIESYYYTAWPFGQGDYRRMRYGFVSATDYTMAGQEWAINRNNYEERESGILTPDANTYLTFRVDMPTQLSYHYVRQIWVYPEFDKE